MRQKNCKVCGDWFDTIKEVAEHIIVEHNNVGRYMSGKAQTSTEIVYHDVETDDVWVVDEAAYNEEVLSSYKCACGEIEKVYYTVTFVMPNGTTVVGDYTAGEYVQYTPSYDNGGLNSEEEFFNGWYSDSDYGTGYDGVVTKDITIYAKVSTKEESDESEYCTITYITDSKFTQEVEVGTYNLWTPTYDNTGLTFEANVFEDWYTDADYAEIFSGIVTGDITLYAKISNEVNEDEDYKYYHVGYTIDGTDKVRKTVKIGTSFSNMWVPTVENGYLNDGEVFDGWYIDEDCTELFTGRIIQNIRLYGKIISTDE